MNRVEEDTILLIEDEEPIRKVLANKLRLYGYDVIEAKDGEEGLQKALMERPELIILDLYMPKLSGDKVLKEIRATKWGAHAKAMIFTNLDNEGTVLKIASESEPTHILQKVNTSLDEILNKVTELMRMDQLEVVEG